MNSHFQSSNKTATVTVEPQTLSLSQKSTVAAAKPQTVAAAAAKPQTQTVTAVNDHTRKKSAVAVPSSSSLSTSKVLYTVTLVSTYLMITDKYTD